MVIWMVEDGCWMVIWIPNPSQNSSFCEAYRQSWLSGVVPPSCPRLSPPVPPTSYLRPFTSALREDWEEDEAEEEEETAVGGERKIAATTATTAAAATTTTTKKTTTMTTTITTTTNTTTKTTITTRGEHLLGPPPVGAQQVAPWGPLRPLLGRSWALLGPYWASLGPVLGLSWAILGPS